jgi:hypothetical protein
MPTAYGGPYDETWNSRGRSCTRSRITDGADGLVPNARQQSPFRTAAADLVWIGQQRHIDAQRSPAQPRSGDAASNRVAERGLRSREHRWCDGNAHAERDELRAPEKQHHRKRSKRTLSVAQLELRGVGHRRSRQHPFARRSEREHERDGEQRQHHERYDGSIREHAWDSRQSHPPNGW